MRLPDYTEIPNVGLYLEQTLKYLNDIFADLTSIELTKSMISNYVKLGYLRRPVKKQYDREQIASLLMIALSKQVLSMDNMSKLFHLLGQHMTMDQTYQVFREDFDYLARTVFGGDVADAEKAAAFLQPLEDEEVDAEVQDAFPADGLSGQKGSGKAGGAQADREEGPPAGAGRTDRSAAGEQAERKLASIREAYALLWQVASADVYSIYLNERFSSMEEKA